MAANEMWCVARQELPIYRSIPLGDSWINHQGQQHQQWANNGQQWTIPNWQGPPVPNENVFPSNFVQSADNFESPNHHFEGNNYFQRGRRRPFQHNGYHGEHFKKQRLNHEHFQDHDWRDQKVFDNAETQTDVLSFESTLHGREPESDWEKEILETYICVLQRGKKPLEQQPMPTPLTHNAWKSNGQYTIHAIDGWEYLLRRECFKKSKRLSNGQDFHPERQRHVIIPIDNLLTMEDPRRSFFRQTVMGKLVGIFKENRVLFDRFIGLLREFSIFCPDISSPEEVANAFLTFLPAFTTTVLASLYRLADATMLIHVFKVVNQFRQLNALGISSDPSDKSSDPMNSDDS